MAPTFTKIKSRKKIGQYVEYKPQITVEGAKPHAAPLMESESIAAAPLPAVKFRPKLSQNLIDSGELSEAQIESVILAGNAQMAIIGGEVAGVDGAVRQGFLAGDGTGSGKTRVGLAMIIDQRNRGSQLPAIYLSAKAGLLDQLRSNYASLGEDPSEIIGVKEFKAQKYTLKKGQTLFATYTWLGQVGSRNASKDNYTLLVDALGEHGSDIDYVQIFDEAHEMANTRGNVDDQNATRTTARGSNKATAGLKLQRAFPNSRVLYMTATSGYEPQHIAFADRLGIWGAGRPWSNAGEFINEIKQGGVSAMELVTLGLKARGLYNSKTLSYDGTEFHVKQLPVDAPTKDAIGMLAQTWVNVRKHIEDTLERTHNNKFRWSHYYGSNLRFWDMALTALQARAIVSEAAAEIAKGHQVIIQLTNTLGARQKDAIDAAVAAGESDGTFIDEVFIGPKDIIREYVDAYFPTKRFEQVVDENGKVRYEETPHDDPEAVRKKEAVLKDLEQMPQIGNALDMILSEFRPEDVAEITGRTTRIIRKPDGTNIIENNRTNALKAVEAEQFQNGDRRILIMSPYGFTGFDFHDSVHSPKAGRRVHIVAQGGFNLNLYIQGLGRSNRTAQKSAPKYVMFQTDIPSQARFTSVLARRMGQQGAIVSGQSDAVQSLLDESYNLENTYGQQATRDIATAIERAVRSQLDIDWADGVPAVDLAGLLGMELLQDSGHRPEFDASRMMNRMLNLPIDLQAKLMEQIVNLKTSMEGHARRLGRYSDGSRSIAATTLKVTSNTLLHTDPISGAGTYITEVDGQFVNLTKRKLGEREGGPHALMVSTQESNPDHWDYYSHERSDGRLEPVLVGSPTMQMSQSGTHLVRPIVGLEGRRATVTDTYVAGGSAYKKVTKDEFIGITKDYHQSMPDTYDETIHLVTGAVTPIWSSLRSIANTMSTGPQIRRLTGPGESLIGVKVSGTEADHLIDAFDAEVQRTTADDVALMQRQGAQIVFDNRARIVRDTDPITKEPRVRVEPSYMITPQSIVGMGAVEEKMKYTVSYYIPESKLAQFIDRMKAVSPVASRERGVEPASNEQHMSSRMAENAPTHGSGWDTDAAGRPEYVDESIKQYTMEQAPPMSAWVDDSGTVHGSYHAAGAKPSLRLTVELPSSGTPIATMADVRRLISDVVDQPMIRERTSWRHPGRYEPASGKIIISDAADIQTMAHEAAHSLVDFHLRFTDDDWDTLDPELMALSRTGMSSADPTSTADYKRHEGFAEYFRNLMFAPKQMRQRYPEITKFVDRELSKDVQIALRQASQAIRSFMNTKGIDRVVGHMATAWDGEPGKWWKDKDFQWDDAEWQNIRVSPFTRAMRILGLDNGLRYKNNIFDRLSETLGEDHHALIKAVDTALKIRGDKSIPTWKDPRVLNEEFVWVDTKVGMMLRNGIYLESSQGGGNKFVTLPKQISVGVAPIAQLLTTQRMVKAYNAMLVSRTTLAEAELITDKWTKQYIKRAREVDSMVQAQIERTADKVRADVARVVAEKAAYFQGTMDAKVAELKKQNAPQSAIDEVMKTIDREMAVTKARLYERGEKMVEAHAKRTIKRGEQLKKRIAKATRSRRDRDILRITGIGAGEGGPVKVSKEVMREFDQMSDEERFNVMAAVEFTRQHFDALLDYAVDKNYLGAGEAKDLRDARPFYASLMRSIMSDPDAMALADFAPTELFSQSRSLGNTKNVIQPRDGSHLDILDYFTQLSRMTAAWIHACDANEVLRALADLCEQPRQMSSPGAARLATILSKTNKPSRATVTVRRIKTVMRPVRDEDGEVVVDAATGAAVTEPYHHHVEEHWFAPDPMLASYLKGYGKLQVASNPIAKSLERVVSGMRRVFIMTPPFYIRNRMQDIGAHLSMLPAPTWAPRYWGAKTTAEELTAYALHGGGLGVSSYDPAHQGFDEVIRMFMDEQSDKLSVLNASGKWKNSSAAKLLRSAYRWYEHQFQASEIHPRVVSTRALRDTAEYNNILKTENLRSAEMWAFQQVRNVYNAKSGGTLPKFVSRYMTPFMTVRFTGPKKYFAAWKRNPRFMASRLLAISAAGLIPLLFMLQTDDRRRKAYLQLPEYVRTLFWAVPDPSTVDGFLLIPKPWVAAGPLSMLERSVLELTGIEKKSIRQGFGSALQATMPMSDVPVVPIAALGMDEVANNRKRLTGAPIVPTYEQDKDLSLRKIREDSASALGQMISSITSADPRQIDHLVRAYFSSSGEIALQVSNAFDGTFDSRRFARAMTGVLRESSSGEAKDVTWLIKQGQRAGMTVNPVGALLDQIREENDPTAKSDLKGELYMYAQEVRSQLEDAMEGKGLTPGEELEIIKRVLAKSPYKRKARRAKTKSNAVQSFLKGLPSLK